MDQLAWEMPTPKKPRAKRRGRPRVHPVGCGRHRRRRTVSKHVPVHVTMRLERAVGNARRRDVFRAVRAATFTVLAKRKIRIIHLSIQRSHLHAIVEADDKEMLSRGMQGFQISAARHINGACARSGRVFTDRYYTTFLRTPTQVRNAIAYVLNNWRHHREDARAEVRGFRVDRYSSGITFLFFREYAELDPPLVPIPRLDSLVVEGPGSYLLRAKWKELGWISCWDVPGVDDDPS